MHKKLGAYLLVLIAVVLVPAFQVAAKPKEPAILIDDLSYTPMAPIKTKLKGSIFYAHALGTINCNGRAACEQAGLDGQAVGIRQVFSLKADIDSDGNGLATAGFLELGGESPPIAFKGAGRGSLTCEGDICNLGLELTARTKSGKLVFSLVALDIDHSSAGIVYDSLGGTAEYTPR